MTSTESKPGRDGSKTRGLSSDDGDTLLDLLRDVAQSPSSVDNDKPLAQSPSSVDNDKPLDHHYHQNVNNLMESTIWKDNSSVREWLQGKWLCSPQVNICRNIAKSVEITESILYNITFVSRVVK